MPVLIANRIDERENSDGEKILAFGYSDRRRLPASIEGLFGIRSKNSQGALNFQVGREERALIEVYKLSIYEITCRKKWRSRRIIYCANQK